MSYTPGSGRKVSRSYTRGRGDRGLTEVLREGRTLTDSRRVPGVRLPPRTRRDPRHPLTSVWVPFSTLRRPTRVVDLSHHPGEPRQNTRGSRSGKISRGWGHDRNPLDTHTSVRHGISEYREEGRHSTGSTWTRTPHLSFTLRAPSPPRSDFDPRTSTYSVQE